MATSKQKSPKAALKELRKKAENFDDCMVKQSWCAGNFTLVSKALCHFGKLYFDLASLLQDGDGDVNTAGINAKHFKTFQKHCDASTVSFDIDAEDDLEQDAESDVIGGDAASHEHTDL